MRETTLEDYQQLINLLDGRIDELTKPIPSRQIVRFAEAIRSAKLGDDDSVGTYGAEDYANLLHAQNIVNELLPPIMENIRANSIDPETGWQFVAVEAMNGDAELCAICRSPYQHFENTVEVHCLDMHENAYHGVCRECVRQYAPLEFVERDEVGEWLGANRHVCDAKEMDQKGEGQRVNLIDVIRHHAHETHYFSDIVRKAPDWAKDAFGEWR